MSQTTINLNGDQVDYVFSFLNKYLSNTIKPKRKYNPSPIPTIINVCKM